MPVGEPERDPKRRRPPSVPERCVMAGWNAAGPTDTAMGPWSEPGCCWLPTPSPMVSTHAAAPLDADVPRTTYACMGRHTPGGTSAPSHTDGAALP